MCGLNPLPARASQPEAQPVLTFEDYDMAQEMLEGPAPMEERMMQYKEYLLKREVPDVEQRDLKRFGDS